MDRVVDVATDATVRGVLVQPLVTDVVAEAIVGVSHQAPFGPTVMFGLGGVFVEVFEDVTFGVPPFDRNWATRMVEGIRGFGVLTGARGRPAGDVGALVDTVMAVQRLAIELGDEIAELDVNPLIVRPSGHGVVAVDALIVPASDHDEHAEAIAPKT